MSTRTKQGAMFAAIVAACIVAAGCNSTGDKLLDKSIKGYARFVAAQETAVAITKDPTVDMATKDAVATAMVAAKPFADTLLVGSLEYQDALRQLEVANQYYKGDDPYVLNVAALVLEKEQRLKGLTLAMTPRILEAIRLINSRI